MFLDTGYILALVNTRDSFYQQVQQVAAIVNPPFVTTEAVLTEVANALSRQRFRKLGIATLSNIRHTPDIEIISVDSNLFDRAFILYATHSDKNWGLTDCISFVVMKERGISTVLTTDHHCVQAGFTSIIHNTRS